MSSKLTPIRLLIGCILIVFATAGCFREGFDDEQVNIVSENIPTATTQPTLIPSETSVPSETPIPSTPTETPVNTTLLFFPPTDTAAPTITISPTYTPSWTYTPSNTPTNTATHTPTYTDTPTPTPTHTNTPTPEFSAQNFDRPIADTGNVEPVGTAVAQIGPFELTATRFVFDITQTAAWSLTQTAFAQGIGITPSVTPFIPPTLTPTLPQPTPNFGGGTGSTDTSGEYQRPGQFCYHEVQRGDTLFRLSLRYGVPVLTIAADSNVPNPNLIIVGDTLAIRGCGTTGIFPAATSTPTPTGNTNPGTDNGGGTTNPGACDVYTIQQGDTLYSIARNYGLSVQQLANYNGIVNWSYIRMLDELLIPCA